MTLRLHYNEHTGGCSPGVLEALAGLTARQIAEYEDDSRVKTATARWFGVPESWVLPVNGLDEGLFLAAQSAALASRMNYDGLIVEPAFEEYAACITATGGNVVRLAPADDFAFDADRVVRAATPGTSLVYLCDPNNPTGRGLATGDIDAVADALPHATIVVDEAYADFSGRTFIDAGLERRPNIVVGRTFAKAHGLAGLRIGALVAAPETIRKIARLCLPYRINVAASAALVAALADREHLARTIAEAAASRALLAEACARLGLTTWPSEANFLLVRVGAGADRCVAWFEAHGVRIRNRSTLPGCAGCVRITTGPVEHTQTAIQLLEAWHATDCR